jgi:hypothetical protein
VFDILAVFCWQHSRSLRRTSIQHPNNSMAMIGKAEDDKCWWCGDSDLHPLYTSQQPLTIETTANDRDMIYSSPTQRNP